MNGTDVERRAAGEITRDCEIFQIFRATNDELAVVAPMLANYASRRTGHIGLSLYALPDDWPIDAAPTPADLDRRTPISVLDARAESVADNSLLDMFVDPLPDSAGKLFGLRIYSADAASGNALTAWLVNGGDRIERHVRCWVGGVDQGVFGVAGVVTFSPSIASEIPEILMYSPVTQCNLNCVHCISRDTRQRVARLADTIKNDIRRWCAEGHVKSIWTDYSGDILWADARFGGELDFLIGLDVPFSINTNGTHLTPEVSAKLMAANVPEINISIDAARDETYHRIRRGSPPLARIHENIRGLIAARAAAGKTQTVRVGMAFVLMESNLDEWIEFIDQAAGLGVDVVQARHVEAYTPDMEPESLWLNQQRFNEVRPVAVARASALGIAMALPSPFEDLVPQQGHHYCLAPWTTIQILGNGDVLACCVPHTKMGNLGEQSMEQIWNGPVYRSFRRAINSSAPPAMCNVCPIFRKTNNPDSYLVHRTMAEWRSPYDEARAPQERG